MNGIIEKGAGSADSGALERINRYTRRPYKAEEVYTFSVVLCDNEVDRDYECFTRGALEKLAVLFEGKTGLLDHERTSRGQSARIYAAQVKDFPEKRTARGEPYAQLTAQAYVPKNAETAAFIESIESGIRKEVSVGCAVAKRTCSVCGAADCAHQRGRLYDGERCVRILDEPTDAYEFSFVAVPAQRAAGVVKRFSGMQESGERIGSVGALLKALETGDAPAVLDGGLTAELRALEKRAACGDRYRETLSARIRKLSAVAQPEIGAALLDSIVKGLSIEGLEEMAQALHRMAGAKMPVTPQLAGRSAEKTENAADDRAFYI